VLVSAGFLGMGEQGARGEGDDLDGGHAGGQEGQQLDARGGRDAGQPQSGLAHWAMTSTGEYRAITMPMASRACASDAGSRSLSDMASSLLASVRRARGPCQ
jgi:hypothetical protein